MAAISEEEENYVRLALLLKGVSPRAVRIFFDSEFPPTYLSSTLNTNYNTLYDLKVKRVLNQSQWNLLFPRNGVPDSNSFDVTLMICLIRNLTCINRPINGFDGLPLPGETTPGPDLARIKWYRNALAHHDKNTINSAYFNTAWRDISGAVIRLSGQSMNQDCQELKVKILDQSNQEIMLEIKQSQEEIQNLKQIMESLGTEHSKVEENLRWLQNSHITFQTEHSKVTENLKNLRDSHSILTTEFTELLKDPIPLSIRGQIKVELEAWTEDDKMFIETNGAKHVFKCIKENSCVVVTGSFGTGKSSLVRHVALQMQKSGYEILPVTNSEQIIKWYNPSKKILFVVDDFCGLYTMNPMKFESWKNLMKMIKTLVEKKAVKLIMSCRLQVYKDEKMKSLSFYQSRECNLLSEDMCLSKKEQQSIAELYLETKASKINEYYDLFDCFPLLCKLCSKNTKLNIVEFFKNPFTVYQKEIDELQKEGAHVKYCALALCVMFNNRLKEKWLTDDVDKDINSVIKNTYEACKVVKGISRLVLRDELDSLMHTFIRKDGKVYRTIHDKLFDFLAFYFGGVMIHCLINNASSRFIGERFLFGEKSKNYEFMIDLPERYQKMYIDRMVHDLSRGNVVNVFCNINMNNQIFAQSFLKYIKGLNILKQKQLASLCDKRNVSTPLIQCCFIGDKYLVTWCLYHCICNVNHCRTGDGVTPLISACQEGHTKIVEMLLDNIADINKCAYTGESPLFITCQEGHTEIVHMLINNKADINKCADTGSSPLFIACQEGHTEIVQMLINNKADINKCTYTEESPLLIACQEGHTEIVQILLHNKADINKCTYTGESPLFITCQEGHTEIVHLLINNKAVINKCTYTGESPLLIACQEGHTEIVQMLLQNKADINKCRNKEVSPLFIACLEGHTEIVHVLINNKADINKYADTGSSPLFIACQEGHPEIVQMLINNKADIYKCNDTGASPLVISCEKGYTEIVQMLINNKADIYNCTESGSSPLFIACHEGHTKVVQMLINNKADINKCRDTGESPLFIACLEGHTEIVQMLINNKVDINKCTEARESPLFIACLKGHTEVVQMLINYKADIFNCTEARESPLFIACQEGHTKVVQLLINHQADINKC